MHLCGGKCICSRNNYLGIHPLVDTVFVYLYLSGVAGVKIIEAWQLVP